MRAVRFRDLEPGTQELILRRIRRGLPRKLFPRKMAAKEIRSMKRGFSAMELKRIQIAGGILPAEDQDWLLEAVDEFPKLKDMAVDAGFRDPWNFPNFQRSTTSRSPFDDLEGEARLQALEVALSSEASSEQASAWFGQSDQAVHVLLDLEGAASPANSFPHVLDHFLHVHSQPGTPSEDETPRDARSEAVRVLALMNRLSDTSVEVLIQGICLWLWMWSKHVIGSDLGRQVWLRAWPFAVKVTNAAEAGSDQGFTDAGTGAGHVRWSPEECDAFHLPAVKLLRVFRELFGYTEKNYRPFADSDLFAQMRDCAIAAPGRSGVIANYQFTRQLPAFLKIDPDWAKRQLVEPLLTNDDKSVLLWHAVASSWIDSDLLKTIGEEAAKRALDHRLGRRAREDLVVFLVHDALSAFADRREPSISPSRISQMLRSDNEEVREWAAIALWLFQNYAYATKDDQGSDGPSRSFHTAVKPFIEQVWPQERFLVHASMSWHLSRLPAVSGEALPEAVHAVERFLIYLDCSSMFSYGFLEGDMSAQMRMPQLSEAVDDGEKARALLRLLDLTVGDSPDAVIPHDLGFALNRIESLDRSLASGSDFRRLAAAARR